MTILFNMAALPYTGSLSINRSMVSIHVDTFVFWLPFEHITRYFVHSTDLSLAKSLTVFQYECFVPDWAPVSSWLPCIYWLVRLSCMMILPEYCANGTYGHKKNSDWPILKVAIKETLTRSKRVFFITQNACQLCLIFFSP